MDASNEDAVTVHDSVTAEEDVAEVAVESAEVDVEAGLESAVPGSEAASLESDDSADELVQGGSVPAGSVPDEEVLHDSVESRGSERPQAEDEQPVLSETTGPGDEEK